MLWVGQGAESGVCAPLMPGTGTQTLLLPTTVCFGSTLRFDRHTHYLQFISAEHGLDRRGSRGCTEQLLKETELPVIGAGRPRHYLTQVLLLAEQDVGSLQEPQSYLLLPQ